MSENSVQASASEPMDEFCERLRRALVHGQADLAGSSTTSTALPKDCLGLLNDLATIQRFVKSLSEGDLTSELYVRGRLAGSLKALQANLRHLTWQVQQVAAGDLTQKVDFMGDFSKAFNLMIDRLEASQRMEREMRLVSDTMRDAAGDLNRALSQEEVLDSVITFAPGLARGDALDVLLFSENALHIRRATGRQRDTEDELIELEKIDIRLEALPLLAKADRTHLPEIASVADGEILPDYPAVEWARSALAIALVAEGLTLGLMCAFSAEPDYFTQTEAERLMVYISQAGVAMSKARLVDALAWYASTDPLTGVPNRRNFFQRGETELDRARRYGRKFSILMLDIDNFKNINDRYGHQAGDQAISEVAAVCVEILRVSDTVGRLGGEEFAVLLPETEEHPALVIAERLRRAIARRGIRIGDNKDEVVQLTASIGVAVWGGGEESFQGALSKADRAMYHAKQNGRNRTALFKTGAFE